MNQDLFASLPNFFIIGAAKAGTTTLFDLLKQHPQVYLPFNKEPMFFSQDSIYEHGLDWYARTYFKKAVSFPVRGEASPHYLHWSSKVAPRISATFGARPLRFIVIFRDPVSRAHSWYWNMVKEGREELPFEMALEREASRLQEHHAELQETGSMVYGYLQGSRYAMLLQPFLEAFPREQFLFLLQEDLGLEGTPHRLLDFLGIDPQVALSPVISNRSTQPRSRAFQAWLRKQSGWREMAKAVIPLRLRYGIKARLLKANAFPAQYPHLDPVLEARLRDQFAPEVRRLEQLIERDLSAWLPR